MPVDLTRGSQKPGAKKKTKRPRSPSPQTPSALSISSTEDESDTPVKPKLKLKKAPPKPKAKISAASLASSSPSAPAVSKPKSNPAPVPIPAQIPLPVRKKVPAAVNDKYVFVRVNASGALVEDASVEDDAIMWWPARITDPITSRVKLYGKLGLSGRTLEIPPESRKIRISIYSNGSKRRFDEHSFMTPATRAPQPPSKKQKLDGEADAELVESWKRAWRELEADIDYEDDDSEDDLDFDAVMAGRDKGKEKAETEAPSDEESSKEDWEPEEPDHMIDVGRELILMRIKATSTEYWPARVEGFEHKQGRKPVYKLLHVDGTRTSVIRERFFTCDEEEFGTCKLGQVESNVSETAADSDDDEEDADAREPSPIPIWPLPSQSEDAFADLSIHEQFSYAKPVLSAIMNGNYPPANDRHEGFLKGGSSRNTVNKMAAGRGMMSPGDVREVQKVCSRWVLRDGRFAPRMQDEEEKEIEGVPDGSRETELLVAMDVSYDVDVTMIPLPPSQPSNPSQPRFGSPSATTESAGNSSPHPGPDASMMDVLDLESEAGGSTAASQSEDTRATENVSSDSHLPHQRGCEGYEALSGLEKVEYCTNVLLPEAIIQLLLWRNQKRTSIDLLAMEEEHRLHKLGEELTEETDWVEDIRRLRARKEEAIQRKMDGHQRKGSTASNVSSMRGERALRRQ